MAWPTDDIFLLDNTPQHNWGKRPATVGVILHTTEGSGPTRTDALATAQWQQSNPGSYNFIVYDKDTPDAKGGVLLTIPFKEACGGLAGPGTTFWNPERWLKELLPANAFADPTMYHLQISFSGKARALSEGRYPDNMIETAAKLIRWAEDSDWAADDLIVSAHANWQDNRSDPGAGVVDRVLTAYESLADQPDVTQELTLAEKLERCRKRKDRMKRRLESAEAKIAAAQEALGGTE